MKKLIIIGLMLISARAFAQDIDASTGSRISAADAQKVLDQQNAARKEVGAPPLKWNKDLSAYAQKWADYLAGTKKFEHNPEHKYGENIFKGSGNYTPLDGSLAWYGEKKDYRYGKFATGGMVGHYTQMVWANTTDIGVGVATDSDGNLYVVADYSPPGNWIGEYPYVR